MLEKLLDKVDKCSLDKLRLCPSYGLGDWTAVSSGERTGVFGGGQARPPVDGSRTLCEGSASPGSCC